MSGPDDAGPQRRPILSRLRWPLSAVWIIPIVAAAVAIGLAVQRIAREGPTVTITFKSASGVEAGKTLVKYKDVTIGVVTAVRLSADLVTAQVSARMVRQATPLMTQGAAFWIVRPRFSLSEVSGLGTLLSGNYIGFDRGNGGEGERNFVGLESPRVVSLGTPGRLFTLRATDAGSVDVGETVYYHGVQAGKVTAYELDSGGRAVNVNVFVNAPYDAHVHAATRFWNVSGVDFSVDGAGLNVRTKSLASVLLGGLAFDDSPVGNASEAVRDGAVFTLFPDQAAAMKQPDPDERRYVLYFNESLEGVAAGSPVTLLGIACGEVTSVGFTFDPRTRRLRGRLEITFSPERLIERLPSAEAAELRDIDRNPAKRTAFLRQAIVRDGLRAQLRSASLISGQRFVAFDYVADPPPAILNWRQEPLELPVVPGVLPAFEKKLTALLNKLDAIPLAQMAGETRESMREARMTLASVRGLVGDIDEKALPGLVAALEDARGALATAQRTLDEASTTLVGPEAPGQRDLRAALQEVTRAARAVRVLSDSIERQPESLLRGRKAEANPR